MDSSLVLGAIASVFAVFLWSSWSRLQARKRDEGFGRLHGCLQPPLLENQRPFGLDRLEQIFRANTESRLMELFHFHFQQTGHTLKQVFLGTPAYGTIEPANLEAIMSTNFKDYGMGPRREITFPLFGDGIFTQDGPAWKHSRQILRHQFQHKQYEDLVVFNDGIKDLIDVVINGNGNDGVVDLQPLFFLFTLDTTTAFLFGESVRSLRGSSATDEQSFGEAFNIAQEYIAQRFRLMGLYWLIGGKKFRESCKRVNDFADTIIDRNLSRDKSTGGQENYVFLDSVAKNTKDRAALRGQIVNILAAGKDTTASLLSWTFFLLLRHPQVLNRLKREIQSSVGGSQSNRLRRTDLFNMKYFQNVLKETLRLYPSVPVNTRSANCTTILPHGGGPDQTSPVLIPEGSAVAFCVYAMHRRPDLYGMDAETFRPERWEAALPMHQDSTKTKWGYLPFNGGPRACLGMDFALTQAAYAVIRLLQEFPDISLPTGESMEIIGVEKQKMTVVISISNGCWVQTKAKNA